MKVVLVHQENAPAAHKSVVAMADMHDCGFELVNPLSTTGLLTQFLIGYYCEMFI